MRIIKVIPRVGLDMEDIARIGRDVALFEVDLFRRVCNACSGCRGLVRSFLEVLLSDLVYVESRVARSLPLLWHVFESISVSFISSEYSTPPASIDSDGEVRIYIPSMFLHSSLVLRLVESRVRSGLDVDSAIMDVLDRLIRLVRSLPEVASRSSTVLRDVVSSGLVPDDVYSTLTSDDVYVEKFCSNRMDLCRSFAYFYNAVRGSMSRGTLLLALIHEVLHYAYAHDERLRRVVRKLELYYPDIVSIPRVRMLILDIVNTVFDAVINPQVIQISRLVTASTISSEMFKLLELACGAYRYIMRLPEHVEKLRQASRDVEYLLFRLDIVNVRRVDRSSQYVDDVENAIRRIIQILTKPLEELSSVGKRIFGKLVEMSYISRQDVDDWVSIAVPQDSTPEEVAIQILRPILELISRTDIDIVAKCLEKHSPKIDIGARYGEDVEYCRKPTIIRGAVDRRSIVEELSKALKSYGLESGGYSREISNVRSIVEWRRLILDIYHTVSRGGIGIEVSTWSAPSRILGIPGTVRLTPNIIALVDTSGSITVRELEIFIGEIARLVEKLRVTTHVIFWDVEAYGPYRVETARDIYKKLIKNIKGGGGTKIRPALEKALELAKRLNTKPIPILVLTDSEIQDIEDKETQRLITELSTITRPRIWLTTYKTPPKQIQHNWKTYKIEV